jgi:hypothetical protein
LRDGPGDDHGRSIGHDAHRMGVAMVIWVSAGSNHVGAREM